MDVHNLFINSSIVDDRFSPGTIKGIFNSTEEIFQEYPHGVYRVNPSSGSYYWDNLHDLNKDGFVEEDEMRLLLFTASAITRSPGGAVRFARIGVEYNF